MADLSKDVKSRCTPAQRYSFICRSSHVQVITRVSDFPAGLLDLAPKSMVEEIRWLENMPSSPVAYTVEPKGPLQSTDCLLFQDETSYNRACCSMNPSATIVIDFSFYKVAILLPGLRIKFDHILPSKSLSLSDNIFIPDLLIPALSTSFPMRPLCRKAASLFTKYTKS